MGMYDTFYGEITCPYCGEKHKFEEQTKDYNNMLNDFLLGDYIDDEKTDTTYIYSFDACCYKYKRKFKGHIIIVNGQIVKFVNDYELKQISDINKLKNIEKGLGHKLEYLERCKAGIGMNNEVANHGITLFKNEDINWNGKPKNIGDIIHTLGHNWTIKEVYKEVYIDKDTFYRAWHDENNYIYRVSGDLGNRIIKSTNYYTKVFYDKGFKKGFDTENTNNFYISQGCNLIKINNNKNQTYNKKEYNENELVQYYVVNKDLHMSPGKIAAQVAHVATIIAVSESKKISNMQQFFTWYNNNQTKIILRGHQKDLEKLVTQGFYYIRDHGLTEIKPNSLTVVGLGVITRKEAKPYIKRLKLL